MVKYNTIKRWDEKYWTIASVGEKCYNKNTKKR